MLEHLDNASGCIVAMVNGKRSDTFARRIADYTTAHAAALDALEAAFMDEGDVATLHHSERDDEGAARLWFDAAPLAESDGEDLFDVAEDND